jgi:hypothetical protein
LFGICNCIIGLWLRWQSNFRLEKGSLDTLCYDRKKLHARKRGCIHALLMAMATRAANSPWPRRPIRDCRKTTWSA